VESALILVYVILITLELRELLYNIIHNKFSCSYMKIYVRLFFPLSRSWKNDKNYSNRRIPTNRWKTKKIFFKCRNRLLLWTTIAKTRSFTWHIWTIKKQNHLEKLFKNGRKLKEIERDTRDQSDCELWQSLRKEMLTASNFGVVCRMRPTTSCAMTVKNMFFRLLIPQLWNIVMIWRKQRHKI